MNSMIRKDEIDMLQKSMSMPPELTRRQQEVARLLSETGLSDKEVAAHLDISEGTMRKHVENVYRRVGVHSRAELTVKLSRTSTQ